MIKPFNRVLRSEARRCRTVSKRLCRIGLLFPSGSVFPDRRRDVFRPILKNRFTAALCGLLAVTCVSAMGGRRSKSAKADAAAFSRAYIQQSGAVFDDNGSVIGYYDSKGQFVGQRQKPQRGGTSDEQKCVSVSAKVLKKRMLEPGESITICERSVNMESLMGKVQSMFGEACRSIKEQILYVVLTADGTYELRRGDMNDGNSESVLFKPRLNAGDRILAIIHDHPVQVDREHVRPGQEDYSLWPSEADAIVAIKYNADAYVHDCRSGGMSVTYLRDEKGKRNANWKNVMKVENGNPTKELAAPPNGHYCNGHDPYDKTQYERYANDKLTSACQVDKREKTPSLGAVASSAIGGYCTCSSPYLFGEHVRVSRGSALRGGKTRHIGVVGFVCGKCCRIHRATYAKAKALKAKQEGEGVPTFWMDLQLQLVEDFKSRMASLPEAERRKMAEAMFRNLQSAAGKGR